METQQRGLDEGLKGKSGRVEGRWGGRRSGTHTISLSRVGGTESPFFEIVCIIYKIGWTLRITCVGVGR